ncbi:MAG: NTP transferase domain-containing protein [Lawsonibacter sp.]
MNKHIIYLAAGSGSRFGSNKLLCPLEGKPLFRHGLDTLAGLVRARKDCDLTIVSRYGPVLEAAQAAGARAVDSPDSARGLSFTIRAGLSALSPISPEDFLLFAAADQPRLGSGTAARLLDAARPGVLTAAACWEGQPGNPVLFSAALLPELEALTGDQGDGWCCAATGTAVSFSRQRTLWSWLMRILQRRCWPSGRENRTP